jgi:hypothetical protein
MTRLAVGWPALARNVAWRCHGSAPQIRLSLDQGQAPEARRWQRQGAECWMNVVLWIVQGLAAAFVGVARALQL